MSGICGIVNFDGAPVDPELLKKMAEAAAHRGPDGIRYLINGNVGLAHLALNATPESLRERQPLLSTDGLVCLTADARVDNRDELIRTLTAKGYLLAKDPTDADLILASYQCWGEACPEHIIGDFAFAIWDGHKQRLFCARDALGVKPLHYSQVGQIVCVASEAQQIIQHPAIPRRLDEVAIADHLVNNCYDEERTIFLDVRRLPPAHRLIGTEAGVRLERYWDIDPEARTVYQDDDDYAAHFLDLFRRAVADRLRTQANAVGIEMSGGLDSCSVAAIAQRMLTQGDGLPALVAYSYAFDQACDCDERSYSQAMTVELGVVIEYIEAEQFWYLGDPVAFRPVLETPFMTWESLGCHMFSRLRKRGATVLLTGHGGDSVVSGSRLTYADRLLRGEIGVLWELVHQARELSIPPRQLLSAYVRLFMDVVSSLLPSTSVEYLRRLIGRDARPRVPPWITTDFVGRIDLAERMAGSPVPRRFLSRARQANYQSAIALHSVGRAVYWYDRTGARFGLEPRHPFLDRRLIEFILSIPPEQLFQAGRSKLLLRRAMDGVLPEIIRLRQDKTRFTGFKNFSLREKETKQIRSLLEVPLSGKLGIVDAERLRRAYDDYCAGGVYSPDDTLWLAITLELWLRQYHAIFVDGQRRGTHSTRQVVPLSSVGSG